MNKPTTCAKKKTGTAGDVFKKSAKNRLADGEVVKEQPYMAPILVFTQVDYLIVVLRQDGLPRNLVCMTFKCIMDVHRPRRFDIRIPNVVNHTFNMEILKRLV